MTAQLDMIGEKPDRARWADFDADFTPRAVVRQGLEVISRLCKPPRALWDPCAGAGVFGQVARELFPSVLTIGTELRCEEAPNVARNYDFGRIGSFVDELDVREPVDAIATNPPWSLWTELVPIALSRLELGGWLALLGPVGWGSSFEPADGLRIFEVHPPAFELRVPGRVKFRTGINPRTGTAYSADHRKVAWWVWRKTWHVSEPKRLGELGWQTRVLPELAADDRRWIVRPGTE